MILFVFSKTIWAGAKRGYNPFKFAVIVRFVKARWSVVLWLLMVAGLHCATVTAQETQTEVETGTETVADAVYPPSGERLRALADRLDFQIGYAARFNWAELDQSALYENITSSEFNIVTPENSVKWVNVQPDQGSFDFTDMDNLRNFADAHGMEIHGHPLTWHDQNPMWLDKLPAADVSDALRAHINTVVGRYAGRIATWDVVNEALNHEGTGMRENPFLIALGEFYLDEAFAAARAADPSATLLYNEYDVGWLNEKSEMMYELVERLLARDVPIDGVGLQMHVNHTFVHGEGLSNNMQRYADLGLDVYITEFDVKALDPEDYEQQALVYEDILKRCLMQPVCKAFQIWGIDDFHSWQPYFDPLPFDDDFSIKPAYYGMQRGLMTQPVHPEACLLNGFEVSSGSVYMQASDAVGELDEAFTIRCASVELSGEFSEVSIRYRNPALISSRLSIATESGVQLTTVDLPPTSLLDDGDYVTLTVPVENSVTGPQTLLLKFTESTSGGTGLEVGLDALLFETPAQSVLVSQASSGGGSLSWWGVALLLGGIQRRLRREPRFPIPVTEPPAMLKSPSI